MPRTVLTDLSRADHHPTIKINIIIFIAEIIIQIVVLAQYVILPHHFVGFQLPN